jgi:hypothetical protein
MKHSFLKVHFAKSTTWKDISYRIEVLIGNYKQYYILGFDSVQSGISYWPFGGTCCFHLQWRSVRQAENWYFDREDGDNKFLRSVGTHPPHYTASHRRTQYSSGYFRSSYAQSSKFTFLSSLFLYPRCLLPCMMLFCRHEKYENLFSSIKANFCAFSVRKRIPFANTPHITCILWPTGGGASFIWGTGYLLYESNNFCSNSVSMLKYPALN